MKRYRLLFLLLLGLLAALLVWFYHQRATDEATRLTVNFSRTQLSEPTSAVEPLRIAVAAMTSPQTTEFLYRDLLELIGSQLGRPVIFVQRPTYEEVDTMLSEQRLDLAFVCSASYALGHDAYGLELLVTPVIAGQHVYHSAIIVAKDSPFQSLESLRDKHFAFTSRLSNTGYLAPKFMLSQRQETPESFFTTISYSQSHDKSIHAVAHGLVDGAAVDSLILDQMLRQQDPSALKVRVIAVSQDFALPPVVVPKALDPALKHQLTEIFLNLHQTEQGRAILSPLNIDYFTRTDDEAYNEIRTMARLCTDQ